MMGTNINMFGHEGIPYESPSGYGAECYSKMKPDRSLMPGLNAIYELKDVPGLLKQRFELNGLHEIGDYYLALKFGWQPLLTDCINFVLTHINAQKVLKQLLRDEGKPVRRRIDLFDIFSDPDITSGGGDLVPLLVTYFYSAPGTYTNQVRSRDHLWASARFRYWLPPGPRDVLWTAKMKARIFGFKPTPRVVYNAIPWSWLVDWFSHIGYMIDNLDTTLVDRLAADYFYVMRNKEWIASQTVTSHLRRDQTLEPFAVTAVGTHRRGFKCREHGDPFGWATPETSLSGVQLSILGALGLSRLR
nr:MAG: hypothetical protein 1 [Leviviridae sp.]